MYTVNIEINTSQALLSWEETYSIENSVDNLIACKNSDQMAFFFALNSTISLLIGTINDTIYLSKCTAGELRSKFIQLIHLRIVEPRGLSRSVTIFV